MTGVDGEGSLGIFRESSRLGGSLLKRGLASGEFRWRWRLSSVATASCGGPFAGKLLGAGFAGERNEVLEIFGAVDIDRNPRERQHYAKFSSGLGGSVVRLEAVVAEAQRKQSGGTAVSGVGAATICCGD